MGCGRVFQLGPGQAKWPRSGRVYCEGPRPETSGQGARAGAATGARAGTRAGDQCGAAICRRGVYSAVLCSTPVHTQTPASKQQAAPSLRVSLSGAQL